MARSGTDPVKGDGTRQGGAGKSGAAFRTIGEVAKEIDVATHVLRFWESKFPQVQPFRGTGNRRYYRREDVEILKEIKFLLHVKGYKIDGAMRLISTSQPAAAPSDRQLIEHVVAELDGIRQLLAGGN